MKKKFIPEKLYKKITEVLPICCIDFVIRKGKQFLLVKRLERPAANRWWFPGGRILFNESLPRASKRKLKEELNIKSFRKIKFLGASGEKFKKGKFNKPVFSIANIFLVDVNEKDTAKIKPDKTMSGYKWFKKINKNFHSYLKRFLKKSGFK